MDEYYLDLVNEADISQDWKSDELVEKLKVARYKLTPIIDELCNTTDFNGNDERLFINKCCLTDEQYQDVIWASEILEEIENVFNKTSKSDYILPNSHVIVNHVSVEHVNRFKHEGPVFIDEKSMAELVELYERMGTVLRRMMVENEQIRKSEMHLRTISKHDPSFHQPSRHEPSLHEQGVPSRHEPSLHEPSLHEPSLHEPSLHEPSLHEPSLHEPSLHEPSLHEPSLHEQRVPSRYEPSFHEQREPSRHEPSFHGHRESSRYESSFHEQREPSKHEQSFHGEREPSRHEASIHEHRELSRHEPSIREPSIHEKSFHGEREPSRHEPSIHEPSIHEKSFHGERDPSRHEASIHEHRELSRHEPSIREPSIHEKSFHGEREPSRHEPSIHEPSIHEKSFHGERDPSRHEPSLHERSIHEKSFHGEREPSRHEPSFHEEREPSRHEPSLHEQREPSRHESSIHGHRESSRYGQREPSRHDPSFHQRSMHEQSSHDFKEPHEDRRSIRSERLYLDEEDYHRSSHSRHDHEMEDVGSYRDPSEHERRRSGKSEGDNRSRLATFGSITPDEERMGDIHRRDSSTSVKSKKSTRFNSGRMEEVFEPYPEEQRSRDVIISEPEKKSTLSFIGQSSSGDLLKSQGSKQDRHVKKDSDKSDENPSIYIRIKCYSDTGGSDNETDDHSVTSPCTKCEDHSSPHVHVKLGGEPVTLKVNQDYIEEGGVYCINTGNEDPGNDIKIVIKQCPECCSTVIGSSSKIEDVLGESHESITLHGKTAAAEVFSSDEEVQVENYCDDASPCFCDQKFTPSSPGLDVVLDVDNVGRSKVLVTDQRQICKSRTSSEFLEKGITCKCSKSRRSVAPSHHSIVSGAQPSHTSLSTSHKAPSSYVREPSMSSSHKPPSSYVREPSIQSRHTLRSSEAVDDENLGFEELPPMSVHDVAPREGSAASYRSLNASYRITPPESPKHTPPPSNRSSLDPSHAISQHSQHEPSHRSADLSYREPSRHSPERSRHSIRSSVAKEKSVIELTRNRICSSMEFDVTTTYSKMRDDGIHHPNPNIVVELKRLGVDQLLRACRPARCCRKAILNERQRTGLPYAVSLRSLPLMSTDIEVIEQSIDMSLRKIKKSTNISQECRDKLAFYVSLGQDDFRPNINFPWVVPVYDVELNKDCNTQFKKKEKPKESDGERWFILKKLPDNQQMSGSKRTENIKFKNVTECNTKSVHVPTNKCSYVYVLKPIRKHRKFVLRPLYQRQESKQGLIKNKLKKVRFKDQILRNQEKQRGIRRNRITLLRKISVCSKVEYDSSSDDQFSEIKTMRQLHSSVRDLCKGDIESISSDVQEANLNLIQRNRKQFRNATAFSIKQCYHVQSHNYRETGDNKKQINNTNKRRSVRSKHDLNQHNYCHLGGLGNTIQRRRRKRRRNISAKLSETSAGMSEYSDDCSTQSNVTNKTYVVNNTVTAPKKDPSFQIDLKDVQFFFKQKEKSEENVRRSKSDFSIENPYNVVCCATSYKQKNMLPVKKLTRSNVTASGDQGLQSEDNRLDKYFEKLRKLYPNTESQVKDDNKILKQSFSDTTINASLKQLSHMKIKSTFKGNMSEQVYCASSSITLVVKRRKILERVSNTTNIARGYRKVDKKINTRKKRLQYYIGLVGDNLTWKQSLSLVPQKYNTMFFNFKPKNEDSKEKEKKSDISIKKSAKSGLKLNRKRTFVKASPNTSIAKIPEIKSKTKTEKPLTSGSIKNSITQTSNNSLQVKESSICKSKEKTQESKCLSTKSDDSSITLPKSNKKLKSETNSKESCASSKKLKKEVKSHHTYKISSHVLNERHKSNFPLNLPTFQIEIQPLRKSKTEKSSEQDNEKSLPKKSHEMKEVIDIYKPAECKLTEKLKLEENSSLINVENLSSSCTLTNENLLSENSEDVEAADKKPTEIRPSLIEALTSPSMLHIDKIIQRKKVQKVYHVNVESEKENAVKCPPKPSFIDGFAAVQSKCSWGPLSVSNESLPVIKELEQRQETKPAKLEAEIPKPVKTEPEKPKVAHKGNKCKEKNCNAAICIEIKKNPDDVKGQETVHTLNYCDKRVCELYKNKALVASTSKHEAKCSKKDDKKAFKLTAKESLHILIDRSKVSIVNKNKSSKKSDKDKQK